MSRLSVVVAVTIACLSIPAVTADQPADEIPQISWHDATKHIGEECAVYGKVITTKNIGSRCFLDFDRDFRNSFTVVINRECFDQFAEAPETMFDGRNVRVTGKVVEYQGKPEIVVTSADQIQIVEQAEPPASSGREAKVEPTPAAPGSAEAEQAEVAACTHTRLTDGVVTVATYNVLNLFDNYDDPYVESELLPGKPEDQLRHLAESIRGLNADVIAMEEVENRPFLKKFAQTYLAGTGYCETVLIEGNSDRGIDVGLLSKLPLGPVTSYRHIDFPDANGHPMRFQRDLLRVNVRPEGYADFDIFVVHLKSKHDPAASLILRKGEAGEIRSVFDQVLTDDPNARFLLCGDFNDTFDSEPLKRIVGAGDRALHEFFDELPKDKQISYNRTYLSMIDFILASPAMSRTYVKDSYSIRSGSVETTGSDHNPVVARFKLPVSPTN